MKICQILPQISHVNSCKKKQHSLTTLLGQSVYSHEEGNCVKCIMRFLGSVLL